LSPGEWEQQIKASPNPPHVQAHTYLEKWASFSRPCAVKCSDGEVYVVKGRQVGRAIVTEQVVARLGAKMGAPVGCVTLVDVPQALIDIEPEMQHLPSGLAHGSLKIPDCTDRLGIQYAQVTQNRSRFARLAVLYGWVHVQHDQQVIYPKFSPFLVYSVDHGHFFPGGPNWISHGLRTAPAPSMDPWFDRDCLFSKEERREALEQLNDVSDEDIAQAVAAPPDDWVFPMADRVELAKYLSERRDSLLAQASLLK